VLWRRVFTGLVVVLIVLAFVLASDRAELNLLCIFGFCNVDDSSDRTGVSRHIFENWSTHKVKNTQIVVGLG